MLRLLLLALTLTAALTAPRFLPRPAGVVVPPADKQRGTHMFGHFDSVSVRQFQELNVEWITLVPYAGQGDVTDSELRFFRGDSVEQVRRRVRWDRQIDAAHRAGYRVFLKPHVWLHAATDGQWRAEIWPDDWAGWWADYRQYILSYAAIAERNGVELFCVGAEFTRLTAERPEAWRALIREVREVYSGQLTYAGNWYAEYEAISFWDALDYIGVQAYFPLADAPEPKLKTLRKGWQRHLKALAAVSDRYERPLLFTELGYKSTVDAAREPWTWIDYDNPTPQAGSVETQAACYRAFFAEVWPQPWFAGVHLWQMRSDFGERQGPWTHLDFTPQGKPAATVIREGFGRR